MGNFNAGIDDVVDVYVRVVAVADTDDAVVLTCFRIFGLSCNLWDAVPPQQRPTCPMFLCQRSLRAALSA